MEGIALYPELARAAVDDRDKLAQLLNAQVPAEFLLDIMLVSDEPRIWQRRDSHGRVWWYVYDPKTLILGE